MLVAFVAFVTMCLPPTKHPTVQQQTATKRGYFCHTINAANVKNSRDLCMHEVPMCLYVCVMYVCVCVCLSLALPVPPTPSSIHAHCPVQSNRSPQLCVLPRCLAFQLASHQKLDACLFYWHVNLCGALPLLHIVVQVFHFCIYCIYNCVLCVFYK